MSFKKPFLHKILSTRYLVLCAILKSDGDFEESVRVLYDYLGFERKRALDQISRVAREGLVVIRKQKKRGQKVKWLEVNPEVRSFVYRLSRAPYIQEWQDEMEKKVNDAILLKNLPLT